MGFLVLYKVRVAFQWDFKRRVNSATRLHMQTSSGLCPVSWDVLQELLLLCKALVPPEMGLLQVQAQQLLLPVLRGFTPALPVPLAETGGISVPTCSQTPLTDTFVWGIQFRAAAWVWSPLPGS